MRKPFTLSKKYLVQGLQEYAVPFLLLDTRKCFDYNSTM